MTSSGIRSTSKWSGSSTFDMVRPVHAVLLRTCSPFTCLVGERRILHSAETDNVVRAVLSLWCSFVLYGACCTYVPECLCRARELHVGALLSAAATDLLCLPGGFAIQLLCARGTATLLRDERWLRLPAHRSPWLCGPPNPIRFVIAGGCVFRHRHLRLGAVRVQVGARLCAAVAITCEALVHRIHQHR